MCIERAHRLGSLRQDTLRGRPAPRRPNILRFREYVDTECVMQSDYKVEEHMFCVDIGYHRE